MSLDTSKCDKCKAKRICTIRDAFERNELNAWTDKIIFRLTYCGYRIGRYNTSEDLDYARSD